MFRPVFWNMIFCHALHLQTYQLYNDERYLACQTPKMVTHRVLCVLRRICTGLGVPNRFGRVGTRRKQP